MISVERGDELPSVLREAYQGRSATSIKFETDAEVIESFGGGCHVYPTQSVDRVEDFLTVPGAPTANPRAWFSDDVRWYTHPRENGK